MQQAARKKLTEALRGLVAAIAADLHAQVSTPSPARQRAVRLHADEKVGEDFEVWTDLLSRRAAVLWVLKSVYVRVLEDRGLLQPGRLFDSEAQQLFELLAPNLGETAFLHWVYRDLASAAGGLPELFASQPAEVAEPSDSLSRALIQFWRRVDPDTGASWSFADERFDGELMGDLYQDLDPVVKDRFALCQTPDFVREFILDRTLTPAIETFGADTVRLLDPACGSGHFLIDGLKRLVKVTGAMHSGWSPVETVRHCLNRVVGIDLNDYACALARSRLVMTAADLAGFRSLAEASTFHPHVYWADGLEQVEREEVKQGQQLGLFDPNKPAPPKATLTRPEIREVLRGVLEPRFHALVANPPYITERDPTRKEYHRTKVGRTRRYVTAYREYSLGAPFTERCFQLAVPSGLVGLITANNFMKREFGKPLIEEVLDRKDLTLVVDTSQASIPNHGTSTVLLFGRNQAPQGRVVRAVMGKRGETGTPEDSAKGKVWESISDGWAESGFENEYVSVLDVPRATFGKHPWSLGGGGAAGLREKIEANAASRLGGKSLIGTGAVTREDEVFLQGRPAAQRKGVPSAQIRPLVEGDCVRDWVIAEPTEAIWPYEPTTLVAVTGDAREAIVSVLWPWKIRLSNRVAYGKNQLEHGLEWFEYSMFFANRFRTPLSIAFAFVATHNHFVLDRGGSVFNRSAPVIKLTATATEDEHFALLGLLNSSTLGFWMRQVFHVKGGESTGTKIQSEPWARRLEYDITKLRVAPISDHSTDRVIAVTRRIDNLAIESARYNPTQVLQGDWVPDALEDALSAARAIRDDSRARMIAWQEELDWLVYVAYGLLDEKHLLPLEFVPEPLSSPHRPFAIRLARKAAAGESTRYWFDAMGVEPATDVPNCYRAETRVRIEARLAIMEENEDIALIEAPEYKRKWEPSDWDSEVKSAALSWLSDAVEEAQRQRGKPATLAHLVAAVQVDPRFLAVATVYQGRRDVDIDALVAEILNAESVPNHPHHIYTPTGMAKREAWEKVWDLQRKEDAGEAVGTIEPPKEYSQGSRGKSTDFLRNEYWKLRGALDVPKERFIGFTEVPGRDGDETLYGWAGWTPVQRIRAMLGIDETLEDNGVPLADRIGLLDSAWRLLPDATREDAAVAARLKAELQAFAGPTGPSAEQIASWKERFPPMGRRKGRS